MSAVDMDELGLVRYQIVSGNDLDYFNLHPFEALPTSILVREDLPVGASVFQVRAKDSDTGFNGKILFSISDGNKENCFKIDMVSGLISVLLPLDRERTDRYFLNITIYDQGDPQMSSWRLLTVFIRITDSNDNPPVFSQSAYDVSVSEDVPADTELLRVRATDTDERARLSFSIYGSVDPVSMRLFRVNPGTGVVYTADRLDYEARTQHILTVMVRGVGQIVEFAMVDSSSNGNNYSPHLSDPFRILHTQVHTEGVPS
uniref:Cadherin domain-containing protein n=1 Tax=Neogobius melanostomus TaxID=47308 RepID=A0A8C6SW53_9GOBI